MQKDIINLFANGERDRWNIVNDGVMGGLSQSEFAISDSGSAVFTGKLSLKNNGGFASVRREPSQYDLRSFTGIRLIVRGDGRTYQFRIKTDELLDGIAYRAEFETVKSEWMEIDLPFSEFDATFRGSIIESAPPLNTSQFRQVGFLIADKIEDPFSLEIKAIKVYNKERAE